MYSTTALLGFDFVLAKFVTIILTTILCERCHDSKLVVWYGVYSQKTLFAIFSLQVPVAGFEPLLFGLLFIYSTTELDNVLSKLVTIILTTILCQRCHDYKLLVWHGVYSQNSLAIFSLPVPVAGFKPLLLGLLVMHTTIAPLRHNLVFTKLVSLILPLFLCHRHHNCKLVALKVLIPLCSLKNSF
jgi:hypothetical protein